MATWIRSVFFGVHYDLHARPSDKAFGAELTPEHLRERLMQVRPDWIQCDGKGHPGYTSYPSKVGSTVPDLVGDPLRIHREVTRELGIKLGVHYSGVWDFRAIELHPEWACRDAEGQPSDRVTCRNSAYLDELMIPQLLEMVEHYDVDGFWVDGDNWGSLPCWCERCVAEFARRTGIGTAPRRPDEPHWGAWLAYHRDLFVEYVERWTRAVHARKPECALTSSYMYGARQPDPRMTVKLDYLSGDLDFRWGAEHALLEARTYDARRSCAGAPLPWNLMAWMHTKPGEMNDPRPWLLKPVVHLCQELSEALALGGAVMVYEKPHRSGRLTGWHHQEIAELAAFCRARQEVCFQSETVPQVAVLHCAAPFYSRNVPLYQYEPGTDPVEGALHALTELHYSTDLLTEDAIAARLDEYPLAVLPEQHGLDKALLARLRSYVERGGHLLITGAHAAAECPDLVGAAPQGPPVEQDVYLAVGGEAVKLAGAWQPVAVVPQPPAAVPGRPDTGVGGCATEVLACRLTQQAPAGDATSEALITRWRLGRGSVLAVHGPLFADYFNWPLPRLRTLIGSLVARFPIEWLVRAEGPPRLEVVLRRKDGRLLVHLLNRGPAVSVLPPKRILIEELPPLQRVTVRIRCKAQPASVFLAPSAQTVTWSYHAGLLTVEVPRVDVHEVLALECGDGA